MIALSVVLAALSANTFAAQKDAVQLIADIDTCTQLSVQYLQQSKAWKEQKVNTIFGNGTKAYTKDNDITYGQYDPSTVDQLYTVFDLSEQKKQAREIVIKAFQDNEPVDIVKGSSGSCTVQVKVKDLS